MSTCAGIPDYVERKGSLFLRSEHMNYSRPILNSNWHQSREAEPKDYCLSSGDVRDLTKSTYDRIASFTDGTLPQTTYTDMSNQVKLKPEFSEQEYKSSMISFKTDTDAKVNLDKYIERDTGAPAEGYGAVLPRHNKEHNARHYETTQLADYKPPFPFTPSMEKEVEAPDYSVAYKRCHSQFTDTADYRRCGRNTWQDETGLYNNSHLKREAPVYRKTQPIREWLE